jgi:contractile injection system tube protein
MSSFPNSPKLLRGGLVLVDPASGAPKGVVALQYNPDSLSRSLQVQGAGEGSERSEALRFKGPAIETIKLEAEIDATDQLEFPDRNPAAAQLGIQPQLAALEALVNPSVEDLLAANDLGSTGTIEIAPAEAPLAIFVWSTQRVVPVRVTEFSITEEAFDPSLNPIRAKVSLGLRVLTTDDLGFENRGGSVFVNYLRTRESLAGKTGTATLASVGLQSIP